MGRLVDGQWTPNDVAAPDHSGRFARQPSRFRDRLSTDGSTPFAPEAGRYHLYASAACPWTHRVLITRALRGLEHAIGVTWADPYMGDQGWTFPEDPVLGARHAWEVYVRARPDYTGRATVPILWDTRRQTIVSNESLDLVRDLDAAFDGLATRGIRLWPDDLDADIRAMIDANYESVNNGVYKAGFAGTQQAHAEAVIALFDRLEALDRHLADRHWLLGDRFTAADICLFVTTFRFDAVYHTHFKCNVLRVQDLEHLWDWTRAVYQLPGVAATCDLDQCKEHYYRSHPSIHPRGYVPLGPRIDFTAPTRRAPVLTA